MDNNRNKGRKRKRKAKNIIKKIYRETSCTVKVGKEETRRFWTNKGVIQGYPLSPPLFHLNIAGLEDSLRKGQEKGGVVVGKIKLWTLEYVDDMTLMAEKAKELKMMMDRLDRFYEEGS